MPAGKSKDATGSCSVWINECCSHPCKNGADCSDGADHTLLTYTCVCAVGYTGENCEEDVNECTEQDPVECESADNCKRCHSLQSAPTTEGGSDVNWFGGA
jgi:hypothetical protein